MKKFRVWWVVAGCVVVVTVTSFFFDYFTYPTLSGVLDGNTVRGLAAIGDYQLTTNPELKMRDAIATQEQLLQKYPGDRDILLNLAKLYREDGNLAKARAAETLAKTLDPNGN